MMGNLETAEAQKSRGEGVIDIRTQSVDSSPHHHESWGFGSRGPATVIESGTWDQIGTAPEDAEARRFQG